MIEKLSNIRIPAIREVICSSGKFVCPLCRASAKTIVTRVSGKIVHVCEKCKFDLNYDWVNGDAVTIDDLIPLLEQYRAKNVRPELSIVILTYNWEQVNMKTIYSVLTNIVDVDYELIVVDNASTDGTPELLKTLSKYGVKIILNPENNGVAKGRNQGAKIARGNYLLFQDNDTVIIKKMSMKPYLDALKDNCISGAFLGIANPTSNTIGKEHFSAKYFNQYALGCFMVVAKNTFDKLKGFDEGFKQCHWDDADFNYSAMLLTKKPFTILPSESTFHIGNLAGRSLRSISFYYSELFDKNTIRMNERWLPIEKRLDNDVTTMLKTINQRYENITDNLQFEVKK